MESVVTHPALPLPLHWHSVPEAWTITEDAALTIVAGARTDLFIDPQTAAEALNAPLLLAHVTGDFMLSARVRVDFAATFDAGALVLYTHDRAWAKLCLEYSPQAAATIVSVVTRGVSDDCNSWPVAGRHAWLRVARLGPACAFHASADGTEWELVRHFALPTEENPAVGFLAQSPTGSGCSATFDDIHYRPQRLSDLRTGV